MKKKMKLLEVFPSTFAIKPTKKKTKFAVKTSKIHFTLPVESIFSKQYVRKLKFNAFFMHFSQFPVRISIFLRISWMLAHSASTWRETAKIPLGREKSLLFFSNETPIISCQAKENSTRCLYTGLNIEEPKIRLQESSLQLEAVTVETESIRGAGSEEGISVKVCYLENQEDDICCGERLRGLQRGEQSVFQELGEKKGQSNHLKSVMQAIARVSRCRNCFCKEVDSKWRLKRAKETLGWAVRLSFHWRRTRKWRHRSNAKARTRAMEASSWSTEAKKRWTASTAKAARVRWNALLLHWNTFS